MSNSQATARRAVSPVIEVATVTRMHGSPAPAPAPHTATLAKEWLPPDLTALALDENAKRNRRQKELIGRQAAKLCSSQEAVMIDGGSTTLQMCAHLAGLNLQVLTNS